MKSLTKVLFKRKSIDEASRFYAMYSGIPWTQAYVTDLNDDNDGDVRSIKSFSTTATVDDNPGTGRVLDTYFFQPAGRVIERLAMRLTIRHLHPGRIEAFLHGGSEFSPWQLPMISFGVTLRAFEKPGFFSLYHSGLRSLVRQAQ